MESAATARSAPVRAGGRLAVRAGVDARRAGWIACGAVLIVAVLFRAYLLRTAYDHIDSDQAVVGLMAYHIQHGDRPIFYYGQPYQGSLEAYAAALLFPLLGVSDFTLRLAPLLFSALFVGAVYLLGLTLYGRRVAILSGLFAALGPSILICWSTVAGGYIETMLCGALLLLLAVRYPDPRAMPALAALACGLLAGFGAWMQPIMIEYLAPVAIAFGLRLLAGWRGDAARKALILLRSVGLIMLGTLVGAMPLLLYNLSHHWATLTYLHSQGPGGDHLLVAAHVVTQAMPMLLGLLVPTTVADLFSREVAAQPWLYWGGVIAGGLILLRYALALPERLIGLTLPLPDARMPGFVHRRAQPLVPWLTRLVVPAGTTNLAQPASSRPQRSQAVGHAIPAGRSPAPSSNAAPAGWHAFAGRRLGPAGSRRSQRVPARAPRDLASRLAVADQAPPASTVARRDGVVALFGLSCLLFFVMTSFGAMHWSTTLPRYLIPLYTVTPFVLNLFLPRQAGRIRAAVVSLGLGALLVAGIATTLSITPRQSLSGLLRVLDARGARVVYTDYWMANRIAFETRERIISLPVTDWLAYGQLRVPAYLTAAQAMPAPHIAWMFNQDSPGDLLFRAALRRRHIRASRTIWREREDDHITVHVVYANLSAPLRPSW